MKNDKIKFVLILIGSITASLVILGIVGVMLYGKIINRSEITIDTTALISILLAFFSIWISVKFYMDAKDTSNAFYQKSDDHVNMQSQLLARMEGSFGEKLKNVEGTLSKLSSVQGNINAADNNLEVAIKEQNEIIDKLKNDINMGKKERDALFNDLELKKEVIENLRSEIKEMNDEASSIISNKTSVTYNDYYHRTLALLEEYGIDIPSYLKSILMDYYKAVGESSLKYLRNMFFDYLKEEYADIQNERVWNKIREIMWIYDISTRLK